MSETTAADDDVSRGAGARLVLSLSLSLSLSPLSKHYASEMPCPKYARHCRAAVAECCVDGRGRADFEVNQKLNLNREFSSLVDSPVNAGVTQTV